MPDSSFVLCHKSFGSSSPVDDQLFDLPAIPQKKLSEESIIRKATFRGGSTGWMRNLQNNLNASPGLRYIKITKGEKEAAVQVQLAFTVSEDGTISNIVVTNNAEVDPHLATYFIREDKNTKSGPPLATKKGL